MKLLVFPRDKNPYQELLYCELRKLGVPCRYAGALTPARPLSLLLLPLELVFCRLRGWSVLHVHWVFGFKLPGSSLLPWLRVVSQWWFGCVLAVARLLRIHVVWTAHNTLPHERVFHDDIAARRALVRASELVFVHSPAALPGLAALGANPRRIAEIPFGTFAQADGSGPLPAPGSGGRPRTVLFLGKLLEYKGIEDLLAVAATLPDDVPLRIVVAGQCRDARLRKRLRQLARQAGERVELQLGHVAGGDLADLFASADAAVLPFRRVTTSSSAMLALAHGRPVIVPDVASFADVPAMAALRYDGTRAGLRAALLGVCDMSSQELARAGEAARAFAGRHSWSDAAQATVRALQRELPSATPGTSLDRAHPGAP